MEHFFLANKNISILLGWYIYNDVYTCRKLEVKKRKRKLAAKQENIITLFVTKRLTISTRNEY